MALKIEFSYLWSTIVDDNVIPSTNARFISSSEDVSYDNARNVRNNENYTFSTSSSEDVSCKSARNVGNS